MDLDSISIDLDPVLVDFCLVNGVDLYISGPCVNGFFQLLEIWNTSLMTFAPSSSDGQLWELKNLFIIQVDFPEFHVCSERVPKSFIYLFFVFLNPHLGMRIGSHWLTYMYITYVSWFVHEFDSSKHSSEGSYDSFMSFDVIVERCPFLFLSQAIGARRNKCWAARTGSQVLRIKGKHLLRPTFAMYIFYLESTIPRCSYMAKWTIG